MYAIHPDVTPVDGDFVVPAAEPGAEPGWVVDHVHAGITAPADGHLLVRWDRTTLAWVPTGDLAVVYSPTRGLDSRSS